MSRAFLGEVLPAVRSELESGTYDEGVPAIRAHRPPSLRAAIEANRDRGALLVEYKRLSPGARQALPTPRTVTEFVRRTGDAPVAGFSCLATAHGFDGSPARVAELAAATPKPVLFKEFVIDPVQVRVAARAGAAAVLLIARLETEGHLRVPLRELADTAHEEGLEVLLELHSPAELSRSPGVRADVFGVNTRDLGTLEFDRATAQDTLRQAAAAGLRPLLGLSGVESASDAGAFWRAGCDGLLVGSAVARSDDPEAFLRSLEREPVGGHR